MPKVVDQASRVLQIMTSAYLTDENLKRLREEDKAACPFSGVIMFGKPRITGSGRTTTPMPMPDKKGKLKKYAIEEWLLYEARVEASGNIQATLSIAAMHAHKMKEADFIIVNHILQYGVAPDIFKRIVSQ